MSNFLKDMIKNFSFYEDNVDVWNEKEKFECLGFRYENKLAYCDDIPIVNKFYDFALISNNSVESVVISDYISSSYNGFILTAEVPHVNVNSEVEIAENIHAMIKTIGLYSKLSINSHDGFELRKNIITMTRIFRVLARYFGMYRYTNANSKIMEWFLENNKTSMREAVEFWMIGMSEIEYKREVEYFLDILGSWLNLENHMNEICKPI